MKATHKTRTDATLPMLLRSFKLPAFVREYGPTADRAAAEGLSHAEYLLALAETEAAERDARRTARRLEESRLPREKTLGNYHLDRLPTKVRATFATLRDGSFVERAINVIAFGNPGTGKTHLLSALGTNWSAKTGRSCSRRPSRSCSACSPPSAICASVRSCASSIASRL